MIKLFAFDLGETLVNYKGLSLDWSNHYERALRQAFKNLLIDFNDNMISEAISILLKYNTRINPRVEEVSAEQIFKEILIPLKISPEKNAQIVKEYFNYFQKDSELAESACELLDFLKINKVRTAVLTDVPYGMPKEYVIKDLGKIFEYFDLIITSEEVGYRKPSTIGLESILKHFQIGNHETAYIGNEQKDIEMSNKLGVYSVLLKPSGDIPDYGQKRTIKKLIEAKSLLSSLV